MSLEQPLASYAQQLLIIITNGWCVRSKYLRTLLLLLADFAPQWQGLASVKRQRGDRAAAR